LIDSGGHLDHDSDPGIFKGYTQQVVLSQLYSPGGSTSLGLKLAVNNVINGRSHFSPHLSLPGGILYQYPIILPHSVKTLTRL